MTILKIKSPKVTTVNQETEQIDEHAKLMEGQVDVNKENTEKIEEPKKEVPTKNQPGEEDIEPGWEEKDDTPPFLLTLEILNHNVHNCLVDYRSSVNVMTLEVCKNINGQPESAAWEVVQLDSTGVKVVGEMKNVLIHFSTNNKICQFIDIMVVDIPGGYGIILNRDWSARLKGYFTSDWSHLLLPLKGTPNQIKILREPFLKHTVTKLGEDNESVDSILGNYLIELELKYHDIGRASPMIDTQPELLQFPQADKDDCRLVDMVSISKIAQLDHG